MKSPCVTRKGLVLSSRDTLLSHQGLQRSRQLDPSSHPPCSGTTQASMSGWPISPDTLTSTSHSTHLWDFSNPKAHRSQERTITSTEQKLQGTCEEMTISRLREKQITCQGSQRQSLNLLAKPAALSATDCAAPASCRHSKGQTLWGRAVPWRWPEHRRGLLGAPERLRISLSIGSPTSLPTG